jgi:hypothetical protein
LRQTPSKLPDITEKVLKTMTEAIYFFKTNKGRSLAVMKKYMRGANEDILEDTYQYTKSSLEEVPIPTLEVTKAALEILAHQYPQAKETDANLIIDTAVMRRIEQSGFIKALYKK